MISVSSCDVTRANSNSSDTGKQQHFTPTAMKMMMVLENDYFS